MARPQNGVNGSISQPAYGYMSSPYNINNQVQRSHNPSVYGYTDMQQVLPSHFLPQGFPTSHALNSSNNIRAVSPMVTQPQYNYIQYPNTQNYTQYQYVPNFVQTPQYMYPVEVPPQTAPVSFPTTTRKLNPLVVVDPTNNTDLDLSKYQSQTVGEKKGRGLLENQKLNELIIEEIKCHIESGQEMVQIDPDKQIQYNVLQDKSQNPILSENIQLEESKEDIHHKEISDYIQYEDKIEQILEEMANKREEYRIKENSVKDETHDEINKGVASLITADIEFDSNTQGSNTDDDGPLQVPEKIKYFVPIHKKESDETTLKRKMIYDREYLISLKSHYQSMMKPRNLPSMSEFSEEIIYNESQNISCEKPETSFTTQLSNDKFNKKQTSKFAVSNSRKYAKPNQPKTIHLDNNDTLLLERSKSSYLPPQLRTKDKEIDPHVELKRNIKCNLNKITPQNFEECLLEINRLNIKEKEEMSCLISEIFTKAVQEEAYSVTYAQFCNKLSNIYKENNSFKSQLLKKCQDMFQTPIQEQLDSVRKEWVLKIDNESDPKIKSLYESDLEEQVKKAKDRYFGNIRFIGELFLHHLLAGKVILNCIIELLKSKSDADALLALCKLMETCGKQIDDRHKEQMNAFIREMNDLSKSKELETRIRFKLKDIVDMRQRDWILRHIQQEKKINPKTIEEQKVEAAAEAASKLAASLIQTKKSHHNPSSNPVVRRQMVVQPQQTFAVKNLACSTLDIDDKPVLGPTRTSNWTAGSGNRAKQRNPESWTNILPKYTNNSRSPDQSPRVTMKNRYRPLESSAECSGADSRSSTPPITHSKNSTKMNVSSPEMVESMTDKERSDIIFNDLLLTNKFDVDNWKQIVHVKPVIGRWIDDMMEKDACCRRSIGDYFTKLIEEKLINHEEFADGICSFISTFDDLIYDIPKVWDFFAEFLERFICDKNSNINFFHTIFKDLLPNKNVAQCLSNTLHAASSRLGHKIVGQVFLKSPLRWDFILPADCISFVEDNDLQFTIDGGARLLHVGHSLQSITDDLKGMLLADRSNEDIFGYLEEHIDRPTWKNTECARTITSCILMAMKSFPKLKARKYLIDKSKIIKQVSQKKTNNEIEILKSVLNVADQLDKEILTIIYDVIITEQLVSTHTFENYLSDSSFKSELNFELTSQIISHLSLGSHPR